MRGPIPAGEQNDLTMFCGGKQEDGEENWEKSALYFKLKDGQKMIGDQIYEGIRLQGRTGKESETLYQTRQRAPRNFPWKAGGISGAASRISAQQRQVVSAQNVRRGCLCHSSV